jgi:prevent-host-death family protein
MKVVNITEIRQDATRVIREAQQLGEAVLIVQRSKPAAYVIPAAQYEALQAELKQLRRAELLRDVAEAEAEVRHGGLPAYDESDALMAALEPEDAADTEPESLRRA